MLCNGVAALGYTEGLVACPDTAFADALGGDPVAVLDGIIAKAIPKAEQPVE